MSLPKIKHVRAFVVRGGGGADLLAGQTYIDNSTFANNTGTGVGAAFSAWAAARIIVTGSTFTGNEALVGLPLVLGGLSGLALGGFGAHLVGGQAHPHVIEREGQQRDAAGHHQ